MIGNFRIALTLATRALGISFSWHGFGRDQLVKPDGFFGLRFPGLPDGQNRAFFCFEADRSTMTTTRFMDKLLRYAVWYDAGGHTRAAGIRNFRVLTVTKSNGRVASLLTAASQAKALSAHWSRLWFTSETSYTNTSAASVLGAIWHMPGDGTPLSLIPGSD